MKILIVNGSDCNDDKYANNCAFDTRKIFTDVIVSVFPPNIDMANIDMVSPANLDEELLTIKQICQYDTILLSGSVFHAYDNIPQVTRQIEFANDIFKSKVPFYGSCWGLQVATVAAGGTVATANNGREVGVAKNLTLTDAGKKHFLFKNKGSQFNAFCVHLDNVVVPPKNSTILCYNEHSAIQALEINHLGGKFIGVQYHPEYDYKIMLGIYKYIYDNLTDKEIETMLNQDVSKYDKKYFMQSYHYLEITNWLRYIKSNPTY